LYEYSFAPVFEEHAPLFDGLSDKQKQIIASSVQKHYPEAAEELEGLVARFKAVGHADITLEYLAAWLYSHELAHTPRKLLSRLDTRECTGIVAEPESHFIYHGGNMDQSPAGARNLSLRVWFIDAAGKIVFEGVDWYRLLTTGVGRAVKQSIATVQDDWRTTIVRSVEDVMADNQEGVVSQMLVF